MGGKNCFEMSGVLKYRGFDKFGVKLRCMTETNAEGKRGKVREPVPGSEMVGKA